jgi:hypothetical protein
MSRPGSILLSGDAEGLRLGGGIGIVGSESGGTVALFAMGVQEHYVPEGGAWFSVKIRHTECK